MAAGEISAVGEAGATEEDEGEGGGSIVGEEGEIIGEGAEGVVDGEGRARAGDNRCHCCAWVGEGKEGPEGREKGSRDSRKEKRRRERNKELQTDFNILGCFWLCFFLGKFRSAVECGPSPLKA